MDRSIVRALISIGVLLGSIVPVTARAVPSFARQTGMPCTTCHTSFPQLTPYGRWFKLNGYTESDEKSKLPPLALMAEPSFTHTNQGVPGGAAPHFDDNDNVALTQLSLFYAGRLFGPYAEQLAGKQIGSYLNHVGTFVQGTYDGVAHEWAMDNAELRAASRTTAYGKELIYGLYTNNNPTMQDVWNTTPAWGFPFASSGLAPTPAASPLIASVGQQVLGGGGYFMFADRYYGEFGGYSTLSAEGQRDLGVDPTDETQIPGMAPYWRLAAEPDWGGHNHLEIGTYGMYAGTYPGRDRSAGQDYVTDVGLDSQYQYLSDRHDVMVMLNAIHESANRHASQALGLAEHGSSDLWSTSATATYLFDKKYGADVQYFDISGRNDALLYPDSRTGSPHSNGFVFEVDWLPLNRRGGPSFWPMSNAKLSLQYVHYLNFDGASKNHAGDGRSASDEDTLYLQLWLVM